MRIAESVKPYLTPQTITSLSEFSVKLPKVSLSKAESTLREISPLFLRETPYASSDSFLTKCLKSAIAAVGLLSYFQKETRDLIAFLPLASQIKTDLEPELENLGNEICQMHHQFLDALFILECEEEKLKVLQGESTAIPIEEILEKFLESYSDTLDARHTTYEKGKKIPIENKPQMIAQHKIHLESLFKQLNTHESQSLEDIQERVDAAEALTHKLQERKADLSMKLGDLAEFLRRSLGIR